MPDCLHSCVQKIIQMEREKYLKEILRAEGLQMEKEVNRL